MPSATASRAPSSLRAAGERLVEAYLASGDRRDLEAAVRHHLPLARRLAHRYARPGVPADDLEQVASLGLVKAIKRFDTSRGYAFSTFAVPTILGELRRHHRDTAWSAHVPRPVQERLFAVRRADAAWRSAHGRRPAVADLADRSGLERDDVVEALVAERALSHVSLDSAITDEEGAVTTWLDRLGETDPSYERVECLSSIEAAMGSLDFDEVEVLRLRFDEDLTHPQIADRLGMPVTRIGRCLNDALAHVAALATAEQAA